MTSRFFAGTLLSALLLCGCSDTESVAGGDDFPNSVETVGALAAAQMTAATARLCPDALLPDVDAEWEGASGGQPGDGARPAPGQDEGILPESAVDYSDTASGTVTVRSGDETVVAVWDDDARSGIYNVLTRTRIRRGPDGGEIRELVAAEDGTAFDGPHPTCEARLVRVLAKSAGGETVVSNSLHAVPGCFASGIAKENEVSRTTARFRGSEVLDSVSHSDGDGDGFLLGGGDGALVVANSVRFERAAGGAETTVRDTVRFRAFADVRENHVVSYAAEISASGELRRRRLVAPGPDEPRPGDSVSFEDTLSTADGYAGRGEIRLILPAQGEPAMVVRSEMELRGAGEAVFFEAVPERPFPMGNAQNDGSLVVRARGDEPWDMELAVTEEGFEGSFRPEGRGGERPVSLDPQGRPRER